MHQVFRSKWACDLEIVPRSIKFGKIVKVNPRYDPAKCESHCSDSVLKMVILAAVSSTGVLRQEMVYKIVRVGSFVKGSDKVLK